MSTQLPTQNETSRRPLPGDLVMKRVEWMRFGMLFGIVIGIDENDVCTVMWHMENGTVNYAQHVLDALRVIDNDEDEKELQNRRCIMT